MPPLSSNGTVDGKWGDPVQPAKYGPFWRSESEIGANAIVESKRVLGNPPTNFFASDIPTVKAYDHPMPKDMSQMNFPAAVEFWTNSPPERMPIFGGQAWWRGEHGGSQHSIDVVVTRLRFRGEAADTPLPGSSGPGQYVPDPRLEHLGRLYGSAYEK